MAADDRIANQGPDRQTAADLVDRQTLLMNELLDMPPTRSSKQVPWASSFTELARWDFPTSSQAVAD